MGGERRLALVVAVDRYDHAALHRLASPAADADALAEVLGDAELGGFEVEILHNPSSSEASERVEQTLADRQSTDLVLLHFSCHGLKDDSGELYLAATNTRPDLLGSTAIDAAWVNRVMQRSRAQRVVLLLDCCYGGAFERGVIARAAGGVDVGDQFRQRQLGEGRGRVVITASTAMEYAFEGARLAEGSPTPPSIFTGALVEGIRTGNADRDQDGHVALGELYDYVYDRVRDSTPNQTPSKWEFGLRGDLYVARNPHRRALATELLELTRHPMAAVRRASVQELAAILTDDEPARAAAARSALERLADDDSRQVSAAALAALAEPTATEPIPEPAAVAPPAPTAPEMKFPLIGDKSGSLLPDQPAPVPTSRPAEPTAAAKPGATEPAPVEPTAAAKPGATEPAPVEPTAAAKPSATEPAPVEPTAAAKPGATEPAPVEPTATAEPGAAEPAPKEPSPEESAPDQPRRLRQAVLIAAIITLIAATGIAIVWLGNRSTTPTTGARDYQGLLAMLPSSVRASCQEGPPDPNSSAAAGCEPGVYELWNSRTAMDNDQSTGFGGTCSSAPTLDHPAAEHLPSGVPAGRIACNFNKNGNGDGYYVVSWEVDDLLMTGTFLSGAGVDEAAYHELYDRALGVLEQM
ncbi:caspase family protein [Actinoplanes sp. NPDC051513]|uniref:caspase, EACC1-associated type n=1 Tax=Actinoplanes sp. NPDC051513 TaxID=3363908 RepID=UPI0037B99E2C